MIMQHALFGGGCFWCTEAVFLQLKGVSAVTSGYAGGHVQQPTYEQICNGDTQHAEVILVQYDETQISFAQLLDVFFATHDPTTLNRQGNDVGTQYRSVIYYLNEEQRGQAQQRIDALKADGLNIVTELSPAPVFYPAEDYHQNFFARNPSQGYCNFAIPPKLMKLRSKFQDLLKEE
jgi:peptide-methionine (S)-S-oxide reductase